MNHISQPKANTEDIILQVYESKAITRGSLILNAYKFLLYKIYFQTGETGSNTLSRGSEYVQN